MKKETPTTAAQLIDNVTASREMTIRPEQMQAKRRLTMDATSISRLGQVICQLEGELEEIELPAFGGGGQPTKGIGVPIRDVVTQDQYLLICNSLIVSALRRAGTPLAGKFFAMKSGEIKAGKRYRQVEVYELELVK